jgi:hypothetical protein
MVAVEEVADLMAAAVGAEVVAVEVIATETGIRRCQS